MERDLRARFPGGESCNAVRRPASTHGTNPPILCSATARDRRYTLVPVPVIKASSLRDLKNRVNIHDVVVRVVALKKAGSGRFKGLCPFHAEKTPSFNV